MSFYRNISTFCYYLETINRNNYRGTELLVILGQYLFSEAYSCHKFGGSSAAIDVLDAIGVKESASSEKNRSVDITDEPHQSSMQRREKCDDRKQRGNKDRF